jgi:hypothetical protein
MISKKMDVVADCGQSAWYLMNDWTIPVDAAAAAPSPPQQPSRRSTLQRKLLHFAQLCLVLMHHRLS